MYLLSIFTLMFQYFLLVSFSWISYRTGHPMTITIFSFFQYGIVLYGKIQNIFNVRTQRIFKQIQISSNILICVLLQIVQGHSYRFILSYQTTYVQYVKFERFTQLFTHIQCPENNFFQDKSGRVNSHSLSEYYRNIESLFSLSASIIDDDDKRILT